MLSHLRLHRRAPSNPTSPLPDQPSPGFLEQNDASTSSLQDPRPTSSSASSALPPTLPPIARVTSEGNLDLDFRNVGGPEGQNHYSNAPFHQNHQRSPNNEHTGFIGGVALQKYRRYRQVGGQSGPINLGNSAFVSPVAPASEHDSRSPVHRPAPSPISANGSSKSSPAPQHQRHGKSTSSFVTPTDLQNAQTASSTTGGKATGKRPSGARLSTEPTMALSVPAPDPPKPKKGLPFLKNPMSTLLMRRKSSQPIPDILPLPLGNRKQDTPNDPSIRGTKVHDFSAPRKKRDGSSVPPSAGSSNGPHQLQHPAQQLSTDALPAYHHDTTISLGDQGLETGQPMDGHSRSKSNVSNSSQQFHQDQDANDPSGLPRPLSLERKPVPCKSPPPVPPKYKPSSVSSRPSTTSKTASVDTVSVLQKSTPSNRTAQSRNVSVSERSVRRHVSGASIPKHMKSTSSRFSFDMIGAAKQEKLLEERHRQRQQEKGTAGPSERDSRFDDFDEDEFNYDEMDFDDGLEERIPGVNADYDEDDGFYEEDIPGINAELIEEEEEEDLDVADDPDNDQENFAGFVFQRSNPASSLASPLSPDMVTTPRDPDGKVIGFAMTKDTTLNTNLLSPSNALDTPPKSPEGVHGLGLRLQGLAASKKGIPVESKAIDDTANNVPDSTPPIDPLPRHLDPNDELYFDNGLREFEGENIDDGQEPFDESLFDLDDTDKFGRPIPGAFAKAQSMRQSHKNQRESDGTSRLSGISGTSESTTTHTSLDSIVPAPLATAESSAGGPCEEKCSNGTETGDGKSPEKTDVQPTQQNHIAAYQAALAAAVCESAASGKFRRASSPPLAEVTITSPTTTTSSQPDMEDLAVENNDNDGFGNDFDDYESDDDAMVAEANASVLANDSDGFYGQEFGFYSAPAGQTPHYVGNAPSAALSAQNLYQYANGGYFGPSGVNRTTSGRVVSREPNLTPITERSEYSNRNSVMSGMGIPPMGGTNPLSSPGLAQLAALAAEDRDDDTMSMSALLKLRSRAWGGSQASLVSSRDGSPRSETGREGAVSPWGTGSGLAGMGGGATSAPGPPARKGSSFSFMSRDSEPGSGTASPTLTMTMPLHQIPSSPPSSTSPGPNIAISPPPMFSPPPPQHHQPPPPSSPFPPVAEDDEDVPQSLEPSRPRSSVQMWSPDLSSSGEISGLASPSSKSAPPPTGNSSSSNNSGGWKRSSGMGHRKRSSADSISYTREKEEESGETRWVIERRRTAESGEVEILGREILESGRI